MADFLTAYKITAKNEGGYVDDLNDAGGETYCGITRKNFPHWTGWTEVDQHKPIKSGTIIPEIDLLVEDFYRNNFWNPVNGNTITDQDLANQVYDMAVNAGVGEALKLMNAA